MRTARTAVVVVAGVGALLLGGQGGAGAEPATRAGGPIVVSMRLSGVVDPFVADYVTGGLEAASDEGAAAVLLTIDTPGGLDSSMREIVKGVLGSPVPVVCFVSPAGARAASAGTFILLACPVAAMAPGTNVGAAHPVGVSGVIERQKVTNDAVAFIRSLAEQRGRNADWAERAVRRSVSASAEEALRLGVIDIVEPGVRSLLDAVNGMPVEVAGGETAVLDTAGATLQNREMGLGARILHGLLRPELAFIFFYLGLGLVVLEFLHPGIGVAGVLGLVSLGAAFVSFGMLPVQLVGILLLVASAVAFLVELKSPGTGIPTAVGTSTLVAGGLLLFDPDVPNARVSLWVIVPVAALVVWFFAFVVRAALRMRHQPAAQELIQLLGREGTAKTDLDPGGVVHVAGEEWTAESTEGTIAAGAKIRVVRTEGLRLKVEPQESPATAPAGRKREGS